MVTSGPIWQKPWQPDWLTQTSCLVSSWCLSSTTTSNPAAAIASTSALCTSSDPLATHPVPAHIITRLLIAFAALSKSSCISSRNVASVIFIFFPYDFIDKFDGGFGLHQSVHLVVYHYRRSQPTSAEATDGFEREHHVVSGVLTGLETKPLNYRIVNIHRAAHVTCGAVADAYDVLALWFKGEMSIERRDAVNLRRRNVQRSGDVAQNLL